MVHRPPPASHGLGVLDPPLAFAAPARQRTFRVAGMRTAVLGNARRGLAAAYTERGLLTGPIVLSATDAGAPSAANLLQAPGLVRRELLFLGHTLWETVVVPWRLGGFAVQWEWVSGPPSGGLAVQVGVHLPAPAGGAYRTRVDDDSEYTLRVTGAGGDEAGVALSLVGGIWVFDEDSDPDGIAVARARWTAHAGDTTTLLVAPLDARGRGPSLGALGALDAHVIQAAARSRSGEGVRLESGVREIDEGFDWARAGVAEARIVEAFPMPVALGELESASGPEGALVEALEPAAHRAWYALGALVGGDHETARAFLSRDPHHPLEALALAEWVAWTGDPGPLLEARRSLLATLESAHGGPRRGSALSAWAGERLADAFEAIGEARWASDLRASVADRSRAPSSGSGMRLPTLTATDPRDAVERALIRALLGETPTEAHPSPDGIVRALDDLASLDNEPRSPEIALVVARARFGLGRSDEAFPDLRAALGGPVRHGPTVSALVPALTLWSTVTGLLGVWPDAAFGRLRLAPTLPATWTGLTVRGLSMGDTRLDLSYRREGATHRWTFTPTAGAVPCMIVFTPLVSLGHDARAPGVHVKVDGEPAEVGLTPSGDRTLVRLQMPLDSERSVSIEGS